MSHTVFFRGSERSGSLSGNNVAETGSRLDFRLGGRLPVITPRDRSVVSQQTLCEFDLIYFCYRTLILFFQNFLQDCDFLFSSLEQCLYDRSRHVNPHRSIQHRSFRACVDDFSRDHCFRATVDVADRFSVGLRFRSSVWRPTRFY